MLATGLPDPEHPLDRDAPGGDELGAKGLELGGGAGRASSGAGTPGESSSPSPASGIEAQGAAAGPLATDTHAPTPLRVTVEDLHALGACHPAIAKFEATFGAHVDVTLENVDRAFQADINVDWWARKVLGSEYEQKRAQAWAEYQRGRAQALAEYERVKAQAWAEYERVTAQTIVALADARAAREVQP